ncbi:hypothetical protein SGFS_080040 [Streptomyces graminofaciens]|uniref:Uncharacterized protein n=1 Tax=Streptomyces graminofaciens TaxID=68212 RepID=A0ABM7FHX8_9ACTN|nr:hypothetical protein SGFS_080040 [Streptomyces graminofaciens]
MIHRGSGAGAGRLKAPAGSGPCRGTGLRIRPHDAYRPLKADGRDEDRISVLGPLRHPRLVLHAECQLRHLVGAQLP